MRCPSLPEAARASAARTSGALARVQLAGDRHDVDPLVRVVIELEAHGAMVTVRRDPQLSGRSVMDSPPR